VKPAFTDARAFAPGYSSMLVGYWESSVSPDEPTEYRSFATDGTCNEGWKQDHSCTWTVAGAEQLPSWSAPWVLQMSFENSSVSSVIVAIDDTSYTIRFQDSNGDAVLSMKRVDPY
jgi:hypothetical protein